MLITAALFAGLVSAVDLLGVMETPEVQPSGTGRQFRLAYHLVLISLLILATAIDFDCYVTHSFALLVKGES